jgi:hypothetical protein
MSFSFNPYKFLLAGFVIVFVVGYLGCFLNPAELRGEEHNHSHTSGNNFCSHFYHQTVHSGVPMVTIFVVLLSTILIPTLGETLPGFAHPLKEPPRSLRA